MQEEVQEREEAGTTAEIQPGWKRTTLLRQKSGPLLLPCQAPRGKRTHYIPSCRTVVYLFRLFSGQATRDVSRSSKLLLRKQAREDIWSFPAGDPQRCRAPLVQLRRRRTTPVPRGRSPRSVWRGVGWAGGFVCMAPPCLRLCLLLLFGCGGSSVLLGVWDSWSWSWSRSWSWSPTERAGLVFRNRSPAGREGALLRVSTRRSRRVFLPHWATSLRFRISARQNVRRSGFARQTETRRAEGGDRSVVSRRTEVLQGRDGAATPQRLPEREGEVWDADRRRQAQTD